LFLGDFCQNAYDGCSLPGACKIYWNSGTTCITVSPDEQLQLNRSYSCNGTCQDGFQSTDNFTCEGKKKTRKYSKK
jgi:hypothetical protein